MILNVEKHVAAVFKCCWQETTEITEYACLINNYFTGVIIDLVDYRILLFIRGGKHLRFSRIASQPRKFFGEIFAREYYIWKFVKVGDRYVVRGMKVRTWNSESFPPLWSYFIVDPNDVLKGLKFAEFKYLEKIAVQLD